MSASATSRSINWSSWTFRRARCNTYSASIRAPAEAGPAEVPRRLRLFRRHRSRVRGAVFRRREGALGACAARLSAAERAVARRADQSPGSRDAARVDGCAAGLRRGDGDRFTRPVLAAQRHGSLADGGRRERAGLRRRSRRISRLAQRAAGAASAGVGGSRQDRQRAGRAKIANAPKRSSGSASNRCAERSRSSKRGSNR